MRVIKIIVVVVGLGLLIRGLRSKEVHVPKADPRLVPAVAEWQRDMRGLDWKEEWSHIKLIEIVDLGSKKDGFANRSTGLIRIGTRPLSKGEYSTKGALYHELGHFLFELEHGSCALMREKAWKEEEYAERWSEWVEEYREECAKHEWRAKF